MEARAVVSEPVRQASRPEAVILDRERALGIANFVIAYLLIAHAGDFNLHAADQVIAVGLGSLFMGVMTARLFGRFHGGDAPTGS